MAGLSSRANAAVRSKPSGAGDENAHAAAKRIRRDPGLVGSTEVLAAGLDRGLDALAPGRRDAFHVEDGQGTEPI